LPTGLAFAVRAFRPLEWFGPVRVRAFLGKIGDLSGHDARARRMSSPLSIKQGLAGSIFVEPGQDDPRLSV
jgi:hypothetical protein